LASVQAMIASIWCYFPDGIPWFGANCHFRNKLSGIDLPEWLLNDMVLCVRFVEAYPECRNSGKNRMRLLRNPKTSEVFWGCGKYPSCNEAIGYVAAPVLEGKAGLQNEDRTPAWYTPEKATKNRDGG